MGLRNHGVLLSLAALLLCGCGSSSAPAVSGQVGSAAPQTRYDMANGCYALKSVPQNAYAVHNGDGSYTAAAAAASGGEPFYMKPTGLGTYMFYARDASFLAVSGNTVGSATAPSEAADWTIDTDAAQHFVVSSVSAAQSLVTDPSTHDLTLGSGSGEFDFVPATGCTDFPEAQLNASGQPFKGNGVGQPVLGMADVHTHISATTFLGGAHYGVPFHKFGITQALENCEAVHGPDGTRDVIGNFEGYNTPVRPHDTVGWPTFVDWPAAASLTHEGTYYKWLERAWMAGLRLLVSPVVENEALCTLESAQLAHVGQDCNEMDSAVTQIQFLRDLQDYVDAQEGGPGKGWFRIVESPAEARQVINDGKLAVVLGIEVSHLFNCDVKNGVPGCSQSDIDTQFQRIYSLGVREMFSIHEFDNAFGGNGIFNGLILNVGNFYDTGRFWNTYDCPAGPYFSNTEAFSGGAIMTTSDPTGLSNTLLGDLQGLLGGIEPLPLYPNTPQCNARALTDLGTYAFNKMMQNKIVMDVDHLDVAIKDNLITLGEQQNPPYPVISAHGGHGGLTVDQAKRILAAGGLIYPNGGNGNEWVQILTQSLQPLKNPNFLFAMGYGADINGLAAQPAARGAGSTPISYPFTLFQGPGWGSDFASIAPITFDRQVTGQRTFDDNAEGVAHYGLRADWVEEVRLEAHDQAIAAAKAGNPALTDAQAEQIGEQASEQALSTLYHSAEAYLEMWERVINR